MNRIAMHVMYIETPFLADEFKASCSCGWVAKNIHLMVARAVNDFENHWAEAFADEMIEEENEGRDND